MNRLRVSSSTLVLLMAGSLSAPSFLAAQSSGAATKSLTITISGRGSEEP